MRYSNNRKNLLDNDKLSHFFIYVVNYCYFCAVANGDSQVFTKFLKYFTFLFVYTIYMMYI